MITNRVGGHGGDANTDTADSILLNELHPPGAPWLHGHPTPRFKTASSNSYSTWRQPPCQSPSSHILSCAWVWPWVMQACC